MARSPAKPSAQAAAKPVPKPAAAKRPAKTPRQPRVTMHPLVWRYAVCRIRHSRNHLEPGGSLLELTLVTPEGAPLPITRTGYCCHFMTEKDLIAAGGPAAFFTAWLDRESATKAWARTEFLWRQGDLFASEAIGE